MGSTLGPVLANVFMCSIKERLEQEDKMPTYYRRFVDDTLTIMPILYVVLHTECHGRWWHEVG